MINLAHRSNAYLRQIIRELNTFNIKARDTLQAIAKERPNLDKASSAFYRVRRKAKQVLASPSAQQKSSEEQDA